MWMCPCVWNFSSRDASFQPVTSMPSVATGFQPVISVVSAATGFQPLP